MTCEELYLGTIGIIGTIMLVGAYIISARNDRIKRKKPYTLTVYGWNGTARIFQNVLHHSCRDGVLTIEFKKYTIIAPLRNVSSVVVSATAPAIEQPEEEPVGNVHVWDGNTGEDYWINTDQ